MKSLRTRIRSVGSTLQLTKAMGLVASSKIRRASDAMEKGRAYAAAVSDTVQVLTACPDCAKSPFMRKGGERTKYVVIAGDRGLAGGYNAGIFRLMRELPQGDVVPIGKRACERFGKTVVSSERFDYANARSLCETLCREFAAGEWDRLGIVSTKYVSMMTQTPQVQWVLPLTADENAPRRSAIFEPDELTVLNEAVPEYVTGLLMAAVRESFASEVAARRMAMDSAGKNATQMIDDLQLQYNRARQGAITQEITEIVAGSGT
jgi:F-type H+-transporting ATPase subunit gamma